MNTAETEAAETTTNDIKQIIKQLEEAANSGIYSLDKNQVNALPTRQYLDSTVVPILSQALKLLVKERPPNPTEFLALYLLRNSRK